jgi:hypothetical protein
VLAAAIAFGRPRDETRLFAALLGIALVTTPILWPHYLILLFVPVALSSRAFSGLWLLPLLFRLDSAPWSYGSATRIVPVLVGTVGIVAIALRGRTHTTIFVSELSCRSRSGPVGPHEGRQPHAARMLADHRQQTT